MRFVEVWFSLFLTTSLIIGYPLHSSELETETKRGSRGQAANIHTLAD